MTLMIRGTNLLRRNYCVYYNWSRQPVGFAGKICAECRFTAKSRFRSRASKKPDDKIAAAISAARPSTASPSRSSIGRRDWH